MGDIIHVDFGVHREWEQTRKKTIEGLVSVGAIFGDSEQIMTAKGEVVISLLKEVIEEMPNVNISLVLPSDLPLEMVAAFKEALKDAALAGVEKATVHAVNALMSRIYDLCTSKLKEGA